MSWIGSIAGLLALALAASKLGTTQSAPPSGLDAKIQQADELQDKGSLQAARDLYESALKALPADQPSSQLGHVLNGLSNVSSSMGEYQQAISFAERADNAYRKLGDVDGRAYALNNRGIAEGALGQYAVAQETFRLALTFCQQAKDVETEVRTLNNLGNAYYFPGQYLEALHAYQDAWTTVEAHSGDTWSEYWRQITRFNEATLYQRLGRYQNALQTFKQVETTSKSLSVSDRGHLLANLGVLYRRLGDSWKALEAYQSALKLYSQQHDSDGEIAVLKNIGIVYALDQGDLNKARKQFVLSLARAKQTHNQREEMQAHLYLGETLLRSDDISGSQVEFQEALARARQLSTSEEEWKALYGIGRVAELSNQLAQAEGLYREAISIIEKTRSQLQISALRAEFLADKRDVYDALISLLLRKDDTKDAFLFLERSRARTFLDRLASTPPNKGTPTSSALSLDEVRQYLDPYTILMEFWVAGDRLALIWCTRESYGAKQLQFSAAERGNILGFLRQLPDNLGPDWRRQIADLGRVIPDGLSLPANLRHALIVPDGWLSSVPFDLVPANGNSDALLIDRFDITYLPTAALLRRESPARPGLRVPWKTELAAFGNPLVPDQSAPDNLDESSRLQPLPYSANEIHGISQLVDGRSEVYLGASNRKSVFLTAHAHQAPILHVSTHAFADIDFPENSRILFSPENAAGGPDYLFLRELYELDLSGVDLTTLSACDTERGRTIRGEGVQAFSRALLSAGSRSSLTTLWRVADQPTSEFMKQFYYFTAQKHQSKAEALRSAKLKFLHSTTELENPRHWAAFVLTGDGLDPIPRFFSWTELGVLVAIAIGMVVSGIWFLLRVRQRIHRVDRAEHVVA